jgi:NAD(P)-dependent dehydrogenase (short-subunit alcohol dehydrogenase family)
MADTQFGKNGWTPERIGSLKGKTFLITGASSGTGFEAAKILASKNAKVVMLNRNPQKSDDCIAAIKKKLAARQTSLQSL